MARPPRPLVQLGKRFLSELKKPPTAAPKCIVDIKHIRENPELYRQTCIERNYETQSTYPARIVQLSEEWQRLQRQSRGIRGQANALRQQLAGPGSSLDDAGGAVSGRTREQLLAEARVLKDQISATEAEEARLQAEIQGLAVAIPNLTSPETPRGDEPALLTYINERREPPPASSDQVWRSHAHISSELNLVDFAGAATTSGWGWYYLLDDAAQLEQALVQYALAVATRHGWSHVSPPSMVYSHIAAACGFQPRDQNGEQQIYAVAQSAADADRGKPELCMAGTAEIPLAGMKANTAIKADDLPAKRVAVSRCYRAEAGARGADTKGLYRVHEFTKVEMFAWTAPSLELTTEVFDEMVDIQTEILSSLGLHCRVLEMPSTDLGASAARKCDIEAFFPSRQQIDDGWGEVTSASICTDYQTRRLSTRLKGEDGRLSFPWTVNGTALAVPRVLAALLEQGWDENDKSVLIPACLRPWMDGKEKITKK